MALQDSPVTAVLDEIERILEEERDGLRRLDREVIDRCAARKTSLESTLRTVLTHAKPGELQRARMERLKAAALVNQMLIAQARSCLKSILQVASGHGPSAPPPAITSTPARAETSQRRLVVQG